MNETLEYTGDTLRYEAHDPRTGRPGQFALNIIGSAGLTLAWIARDKPTAIAIGVSIALVTWIISPVVWTFGPRSSNYIRVQIKKGILSWRSKSPSEKKQSGRIDLHRVTNLEVVWDHEGHPSHFVVMEDDGSEITIPRSIAQTIYAKFRNEFSQIVANHQPHLVEKLQHMNRD